MDSFLILIAKVLPLYGLIILGYLAGKFLGVKKENISPLLIYIISPIVIFNSVLNTKIDISNITLPLLFFSLGCCISLLFLKFSGLFWDDARKNIIAFTAGNGNTGYFGLPVAVAIFGESITGLIMLCVLGFVLYENTLGFYLTARSQLGIKEAVMKLLKLPTIYALMLAITLSLLEVKLGEAYNTFSLNFKGAYTVLGMMLIGLGIASIKSMKFDLKFIMVAFMAKFLVWPAMILSIIWIDSTYFHFWTSTIHQVMLLMSIVPLAANTVAYATELKAEPEKSALAVLLSTVFALFYIPIVIHFSNI